MSSAPLAFIVIALVSVAPQLGLSGCVSDQSGRHVEGHRELCGADDDDDDDTLLLQKSFHIPSADRRGQQAECRRENCNVPGVVDDDDDILMFQKSFHLPSVEAQVHGAGSAALVVDEASPVDSEWQPLEAAKAIVRRVEEEGTAATAAATAADIQGALAYLQASLEPHALPADVKAYNEALESFRASLVKFERCDADYRSGAPTRKLLHENVSECVVKHDACLAKEAEAKDKLKECRRHHPPKDCHDIIVRFQDIECDSTQLARDEAECSYVAQANDLCTSYHGCRASALESYSSWNATLAQVEASSGSNRRLMGVARCVADGLASAKVQTENDVFATLAHCQASVTIPVPGNTKLTITPPMECKDLPCPGTPSCPFCGDAPAQPAPAQPSASALWTHSRLRQWEDTASWLQESAIVVSARKISDMTFVAQKGSNGLPIVVIFLAIPFTLLFAVLCVVLINAHDRVKDGGDEHLHFHGAAAEASHISGLRSDPWSVSAKDPPSAPALPSSASVGGGGNASSDVGGQRGVTLSRSSGPCLCPELIVPNNNECVLVIPSLAKAMRGEVMLRNITNKAGHPLLYVGLTSAPAGITPSPSSLSEYVLLVKKDQKELAFCELTPEASSAGWKGQIFRWNGELYARLREVDASQDLAGGQMIGDLRSFVVVPANANAWELRIHGSFREKKLSIVNEARQVIAMVTPGDDLTMQKQGGEYYKLRLGPQADSCIIIVALLAIERLLMTSVPGA